MVAIMEFLAGIIRDVWVMLGDHAITFGGTQVSVLAVVVYYPFAMWVVIKLWAGMMANQSKEDQ